jgi:hypothetical protein
MSDERLDISFTSRFVSFLEACLDAGDLLHKYQITIAKSGVWHWFLNLVFCIFPKVNRELSSVFNKAMGTILSPIYQQPWKNNCLTKNREFGIVFCSLDCKLPDAEANKIVKVYRKF